jgi:adenylylsulfate kinase-like enzyme
VTVRTGEQTGGMSSDAGVWLITGAQASGKSTIADHLAAQFERSVHVRGGQFYRWAVRGWVHFDDRERAAEARRLLELRYDMSALVADRYAQAGFTCVVQDNIYGDDVTRWLESVTARPLHLVVLRPAVEVVAARDRARRQTIGKVAYRGPYTPADNDRDLASTPSVGLWLDTSTQTPEATVAEIVSRADEAKISL